MPAERVADQVTKQVAGGDRIPVVVLGGWLGAGKTTLVNRLLRDIRGERIAIIVNDVGEVNIDTELVASHHGDTVELTNGCICCSIGDSLGMTLRDLVLGDRPPERILIEASGVAQPDRVASYGDRRRVRPDGVVVAVDASDVVARAADPVYGELVHRQVRAADLLVLTKADVAIDAGAGAAAWCSRVAPDAQVVVSSEGPGWVQLVLGGLDAAEPTPADALDVPVSVSLWQPGGPVDTDRVAAALGEHSEVLVRAKGTFARLGGGAVAVHLAGGRVSVESFGGVPTGRMVLVTGMPPPDLGVLLGALGATRRTGSEVSA